MAKIYFWLLSEDYRLFIISILHNDTIIHTKVYVMSDEDKWSKYQQRTPEDMEKIFPYSRTYIMAIKYIWK